MTAMSGNKVVPSEQPKASDEEDGGPQSDPRREGTGCDEPAVDKSISQSEALVDGQ